MMVTCLQGTKLFIEIEMKWQLCIDIQAEKQPFSLYVYNMVGTTRLYASHICVKHLNLQNNPYRKHLNNISYIGNYLLPVLYNHIFLYNPLHISFYLLLLF